MSNDTKKELEKGKCSACWGKGFYTQLHGIQGFADFIGDKGFETGSTEHKYPCSRCNGSGNEPVPSKNPIEAKIKFSAKNIINFYPKDYDFGACNDCNEKASNED